MPRANRYFLPGYVWHMHRCHQRKFLLKLARDRRRYLHWLFEARKRFWTGLWVESPISRQVKRHRRSCENFSYSLFQPSRNV
jgi:hypothetical protein